MKETDVVGSLNGCLKIPRALGANTGQRLTRGSQSRDAVGEPRGQAGHRGLASQLRVRL